MDNFVNWVTFFCSVIVATIISLVTFFFDVKKHRQTLITQAVTVNRIEWISDVRKLIGDFLTVYIDGKSKEDLAKITMKVELYLRDKPDYNKMLYCMRACYEGSYSEAKAQELVKATQYVFQRVWARIKIEGGQSKGKDANIRALVDDYVGIALNDIQIP